MLGELKINYLKFPCLSAAHQPAEAARARLSAQDAAHSTETVGAMKECLGAVWRRRAEDLSKRISDFTSQSAEHLHLRLSLIKPGKSLSFTSPPNSLSAAAVFFTAGLMSTLSFLFFSFFTPSRCPCQSAWRSWIFHQRKKSRQGQGRWMTSMASRYFQGRVIETNEPCYISWDTESRRPEDPAADRAETGGTQPFQTSPESGCSSKVFSKWLQNMPLSLTHIHTHKDTRTPRLTV